MKGLKIAIALFFGISSICSQHKINGKIIDENNNKGLSSYKNAYYWFSLDYLD